MTDEQFNELVTKHYGRLYNIAARMTWMSEPKETLIMALESLYKNCRRLNFTDCISEDGLFLCLARKKIRWVAMTRKRSEKRRRTAPLLETSACVEPLDGTVLHDVMKALETLTPKQQEVARLIVLEQYTHTEAAAKLGLTKTTVQKRWDTAKVHLMTFLHDYE